MHLGDPGRPFGSAASACKDVCSSFCRRFGFLGLRKRALIE